MEKTSEPVAVITIPEYPTKIKISDKSRATYYKKLRTRWTPRKLPKSYKLKLERNIWSKDEKGFLLNEHKEKVIANPKTAGKPGYEYLSGNRFTTGFGHYAIRSKIVNGLKSYYKEYINLEPITIFPLICEWDFYLKITKSANFDMSNFWFYYKYFEDSLVDKGIIPDDSVKYITKPGAPLLIPVDKWEDRKFVFKFYYDDRPILKENSTWNI